MLFLVLSLALTVAFMGKSYDDAYIIYRCARHFSAGQGMAFNVGSATSTTTTPLFTIVLGILGFISSPDWIPFWGGVLSGFSLFLLTVVIWLHARREGQASVGLFAAACLFANPFLPSVWGGEVLLTLALSMAAFYVYFEDHRFLAVGLCFAAFLSRGEGALPLGIMLVHQLWSRKRIAWDMVVAMVALLSGWLVLAPFLGTTFLPGTLSAKMAQMQSGAFGPFVKTTLDWYLAFLIGSPTFPEINPNPIGLILVILAAGGGMAWLMQPRERWGWILLWPVSYVFGYSVLSVPFYAWYAFPLFMAIVIMAGVGHHAFLRTLDALPAPCRHFGMTIKWGYGALLCVALGFGVMSVVDYARVPVSNPQRLYSETGTWLRENTEPEATVGFFEIGFVGYFSDRSIVCPVGLTHPEVVPHVARGDFTWAWRNFAPDYVLFTAQRWKDRLAPLLSDPAFTAVYEPVQWVEAPDYFDAPVTIYKKNHSVMLPHHASE